MFGDMDENVVKNSSLMWGDSSIHPRAINSMKESVIYLHLKRMRQYSQVAPILKSVNKQIYDFNVASTLFELFLWQ